MASTCVVGLQWGDEAKGKVVDLLTEDHDVVVRFNGGANAGHTVVVDGVVYKLSLVPSGIVHPGRACVIGNGVVVQPEALLREIDELARQGVDASGRLLLSDRAHMILPYHGAEEGIEEGAGDGTALGTTLRGIGPCYADKAARRHSVRVADMLDPATLRRRLRSILPYKNRLLRTLSPDAAQFDVEQLANEYDGLANRLRPFVTDTFWFLQRAIRDGKRILFETAQGSLLDVDHGTYPYVTSSNSSACGLSAGCGVSLRKVDRCVGIVKAYTTRVGAGPFPTELFDETGEMIRREGNEYGTVTGRPRRCGWFDAVAGRYAALLNGVDQVAVMLLDVLSKLDEIRICEAYEIDGERTNEFPAPAERLARCKPVYRTMRGWRRDIAECRKASDLPDEAREYIDAIGAQLETPVTLCSVGPGREQTVHLC